jgi:hypothetical protein
MTVNKVLAVNGVFLGYAYFWVVAVVPFVYNIILPRANHFIFGIIFCSLSWLKHFRESNIYSLFSSFFVISYKTAWMLSSLMLARISSGISDNQPVMAFAKLIFKNIKTTKRCYFNEVKFKK